MDVTRRDFLKTNAAGFLSRLLAGQASIPANDPKAPILGELAQIDLDLEREFYICEEMKARFGLRVDHGFSANLTSKTVLEPDSIGTIKSAKDFMRADPRFSRLGQGTSAENLKELFQLSKKSRNRSVELYEKSMELLRSLQELGETQLPVGVKHFCTSDIAADIKSAQSALQHVKDGSFWEDFIAIAKNPSSVSIRDFIQKQFSWMERGYERETALKEIAGKISLEVNDMGQDAAEQKQEKEWEEGEAERAKKYREETVEKYKQYPLRITNLEGNGDSNIERGLVIESSNEVNLYPLFESLGEVCSWAQEISWPQISADDRRIDIIDPTKKQLELIEPLLKQQRERSYSERVGKQTNTSFDDKNKFR